LPRYSSRMPVIGRAKSNLNFQAQAAMLASITALPRVKNSLTSSSRSAVSLARSSMSSVEYSPLASRGGPGTSCPNSELMPNGTTVAHWGVRAFCTFPRGSPRGTRSGCQLQRSTTLSGC
jgi:hypothetical protein